LLLAHWVLACHLKGCVVDKKPFLAACDEEEDPKKRHREYYSAEEDQTLLNFAAHHEDEKLTQEKRWDLPEESSLLDRNASSMLHRYRTLKQKTNKRSKRYAVFDEHNILAWAHCW
jgi:hypothetical protein